MNKNFLEQSIYSYAISLIGSTSEEIEISLPEEKSCIGQYGRLHKEYLRKNHPNIYFELVHADTLEECGHIPHDAGLSLPRCGDYHCVQAQRLAVSRRSLYFVFSL